ncbi:unnamed protein product [Rodentolepis nana]|uniref:CN hydrolase domain-containing protein n=1 Tax=Rodentolepis nana TaxID=102285 RepID=A0A0R3THJ4_RODNA|nr:unnamed protein product [Rodentolepis nana]
MIKERRFPRLIAATCYDNSNPHLYGPIVTVPGANNVTCKVIWYFPKDKSALSDSLKLLFVGVCKFFLFFQIRIV